MTNNTILNAYNAKDISRRTRSGRIKLIDDVIKVVSEEIVKAADNNFTSVRVDLNGEQWKNRNIDHNVLRGVRNHFEMLNFFVHISEFRKYILIQW